MNQLYQQLNKRKEYLLNLQEKIILQSKDLPEGRLRVNLVLKNGKVRYPDFTLLRLSTRELIYHEHFGLLDDGEYRRACFTKLDEYRNNGIYLGRNLIITYEAEGSYLNIKEIRKQMQSILAR